MLIYPIHKIMQEYIQKLQLIPAQNRNITIVAHIDHGKTTLSDSLLATNDFVNQQQQGKIRMLDFLPIEQERLITVKASSISLVHLSQNWKVKQIFKQEKIPILMQLFDSPGHCDFSQEVLSSLSICDGAILVVDCVEGIRSQTYNMIKILCLLNMQIVLCINKIDRLYDELKLDTTEIYFKIMQIIADINHLIEDTSQKQNYFSLEQNVIIASALGGWGISLTCIVEQIKQCQPLFQNYDNQQLELFFSQSDAYLTKEGLIKNGSQSKTLYISFILDLLSKVLQLTKKQKIYEESKEKLDKIYAQLNNNKQLNGHQSTFQQYRDSFLQSTYPLGKQLMDLLIINTSSPTDTKNTYLFKIQKHFQQQYDFIAVIGKSLYNIDVDEPIKSQKNTNQRHFNLMRIIKQNQQNQIYLNSNFYSIDGNQFQIIGLFQPFGKIFRKINYEQLSSGIIIGIETDVKITNNTLILQNQTIGEIEQQQSDNTLMEQLQVCSSNVTKQRINFQEISAKQLDESQKYYLKTKTKVLQMQTPLVKVSINPDNIQNYNKLVEAVQLMCKQESSVQYELSKLGDIQLIVCGDVHFDLCVDNLKKFVDFEFRISSVHLQIFETAVDGCFPLKQTKNSDNDEILLEYENAIFQFFKVDQIKSDEIEDINDYMMNSLLNFPLLSNNEQQVILPLYYQQIGQNAPHFNQYMKNYTSNVCGTELIIIQLESPLIIQKYQIYLFTLNSTTNFDLQKEYTQQYNDQLNNQLYCSANMPSGLKLTIQKAFQQNIAQGILCLEQMVGIRMVCDYIQQAPQEINFDTYIKSIKSQVQHFYVKPSKSFPSMLGDITQFVRTTMSQCNLRVLEPHFEVLINIPQEYQQEINKLLTKTRAKEINFDCKQHYNMLIMQIKAYIPQEFGIAIGHMIRSQTSGYGEIQFCSSKHILNTEDPRHVDVAMDEEEMIEFGQQGKNKKSDQKAVKNNIKIVGDNVQLDEDVGANVAQRLVNKVLRQKGLFIGEIVEDAEKQRTIKKSR